MTTASAIIDPTGSYRYELRRAWPGGDGLDYSARWGYAVLVVTNLFAFRATDPDQLRRVADPTGPENDRHILAAAKEARLVVVAWGARGCLGRRDLYVLRMLADLGITPHSLATTLGGRPKHPLYMHRGARPTPHSTRECDQP